MSARARASGYRLTPWRLLLLLLAWMVVVGLLLGLIFTSDSGPAPSLPRRTRPTAGGEGTGP